MQEKEKLKELYNNLMKEKNNFNFNNEYQKSKQLLDLINMFKIRAEYASKDYTNFMQEEEKFNFIKNREILIKKDREELVLEINKLTKEISEIENQKQKSALADRVYKDNKILYTLKQDIDELKKIMEKEDSSSAIKEKIQIAKDKIYGTLKELQTEFDLNKGKLYEISGSNQRFNNELKSNIYWEIETRYNKFKVEYMLSVEISRSIQK